MLPEGYHDLPPGMIATIVTSLAMSSVPALRPEVAPPPWRLERLIEPAAETYCRLYRSVGNDWLWFSRLSMEEQALEAVIQSPDVEIYHLAGQAGEDGLLELDFREADACELTFFGLSRPLIGGPAGRWLMNRAIERAWARPIERFWVHTCTFDHPAALAFYQRSGFAPFRQQVEVFADPRLTGVASRDAAAHIPLIEPGAGV